MQRLFISLFCLFFLLSGPISAWADCFRHSHETVEKGHHHGGASDSIQQFHSEYDHSAPPVHCPQLRFDPASLASLSANSDLKPRDHEYKLSSLADLSTEQTSLNIQSCSIRSPGRFSCYPFLVGLSPHVLLSVFII